MENYNTIPILEKGSRGKNYQTYHVFFGIVILDGFGGDDLEPEASEIIVVI